MSIGSGRIITRTGRYKIFPVVGLMVVAVGLGLFSLLGVDTPLPVAGSYMLVLGAGLGMVLQVLVLAVQNAVELRDWARQRRPPPSSARWAGRSGSPSSERCSRRGWAATSPKV